MSEFVYDNVKKVHTQNFAPFEDATVESFAESRIYQKLADTQYVRIENGVETKTETCTLENHLGPVFTNLEGDYNYLRRWFNNPFRKANTRHGSYIMLYLTEEGYQWKLSESFFTKILSIPDNITDLFDYG